MSALITAGNWNLDPTHSEVNFSVRHAGISRVRGTFEDVSGVAVFTDDLIGSTVEASALTNSVNTRNKDRDAHLRSADFFDSQQYSTITFESLEITEVDGEDFTLRGNLTIRDATRPVEFKGEFGGQAVDPFGVLRAGFSAVGEIKREDFGLTWNAALEAGGFLVSSKVKIEIDASFVQADGEDA